MRRTQDESLLIALFRAARSRSEESAQSILDVCREIASVEANSTEILSVIALQPNSHADMFSAWTTN